MADDFDIDKQQAEVKEYLAKIRKTIADSNSLIEQAQLRMQETDRLLAAQGLTREQVLAFQFSDEQRELVNDELVRRGLEPLDFTAQDGFDDLTDRVRDVDDIASPAEVPDDEDLTNERAGKFRMMMREFRIS